MFLRGREQTCFKVYRKKTMRSNGGRVLQQGMEELCQFVGILGQGNSFQRERWDQLTHPVTHRIFVEGHQLSVSLLVGDVLEFYDQWTGKNREILLSGVPYDVAGLGTWVILYGQERRDLV